MERGDLIAGRYRLDAEASAPGTGEAWRATDQETGMIVLLERVPMPDLPADERDAHREQVRTDIAIASLLDHPNIAPVLGVVAHEGADWLISKFVSAPSLVGLAAAGPLAPGRVAAIGAEAAAALAYAHSPALGVVHRALTPRNILVGGGDHVTVTGFGTPRGDASKYMAPEVANGLAPGPQADVFSLAASLYEAVEGRSPWGDGDAEQIRAAARKGVVEPPRRAGGLGPVLMRMLESRPRERPTAAEAAHLLAEVAENAASGPGVRGGRRWPLIAVAVAVVVAVAAGLVVWLRPAPAALDVAAPSGPSLGDPATADPCGLLPPEPLDRFGDTLLEAEFGNFDRCDVTIDTGENRSTVQLWFARSGPNLPQGVPEERDGLVIVRADQVGEDCARTIRLTDGYDIRILARPVRGPLPEPCPMADVATDSALAVLAAGPVPRRSGPFDPGSLALVDACGLLDRGTVATVPGLETAEAAPGFAGWACRWENAAVGSSVEVEFDRNRGGIGRDAGNPVTIEGREAAARRDEDGAGCDITIMHRPYTDKRGYPAAELLIVKYDLAAPPPGAPPPPDPCPRGIEIATEVVKRVPAAP